MNSPSSTPQNPDSQGAPSAVEMLLWGVLAMVVLGIVGFVAWVRWNAPPTPVTPPLPVIAEVPDFTLINRDGSTVRRQDLLGQPWVADFIFTRCAAICPRMTYQLRRVVDGLGPDAGVGFVSFSVDPEHDTPAVLEEFASRYEAPPHWRFLTGDRQVLHDLSKKGFLLALDEAPPTGPAAGGDPIIHSSRLVLVDQQGRIRSYYDAFDDDELARLLADLEELLTLQ